jgi:nucleoside-diphosphate-sugar epimerase
MPSLVEVALQVLFDFSVHPREPKLRVAPAPHTRELHDVTNAGTLGGVNEAALRFEHAFVRPGDHQRPLHAIENTAQCCRYYLPGTLTGVDPTKRELVVPIGASELAPVDIEDIAKVAVALLRAGGHQRKSYYMSGPQALTMTEVVEQISEATGTTFRYTDVSFEQKHTELVAAGLPPDAIDLLDELFRERRRCTKSTVDLNTRKTFGVEPTTFAQFARLHATAFLRQPDSVVTTS